MDIQTARNAGVKSCGLTYGFQPETLSDPPPDLLFDRMESLADWILNHRGRRTMTHRPGTTVPDTGIYWCTVCKSPELFDAGQQFPECKNMCGRGYWQLVEKSEEGQ